jgi:hypothetical protein
MSIGPGPAGVAVLAASLAVLGAPSIAHAESARSGTDETVFVGVRRLPAANGLEPALRAAGYGDLRTFEGWGYSIGLSVDRWRGQLTAFWAFGEARSAAGRIGAALADGHLELGYDVVQEREVLVSVLGGLGCTDLRVDARAPGWTLFASQLGSHDDPRRVSNSNLSGSLQIVVETFVPFDERGRWGVSWGLRGGWFVPIGSFGWTTDEDHAKKLHGPVVDLGGEWLAVSVGLTGWPQ